MFFFRLHPGFVLGIGCLCVAGAGRADTSVQKSARRDILSMYAKVAQAQKHKDLTPIVQVESADYQAFTPLGTFNRDQSIALAQQFVASMKSISKVEHKTLSWTWRGPDAVVVSQTTTVATALRAGKSLRLEAVSISRDYWSRTGFGWQIRQSVDRGTKLWLNGRRVQ